VAHGDQAVGTDSGCGLGLGLPGCSSTPTDGTITGVASPCTGPISPTPYSKLPVTVYLSQGSHAVAHQTLTGTHTFHFEVPAGDNIVSTHEGEGSKPVSVAVRPGETIHVNIPSFCM